MASSSTTYRAIGDGPRRPFKTFDELLEACGGSGQYQVWLLLLLGSILGAAGQIGLSFYFVSRAVPLGCPPSDGGDGTSNVCDPSADEKGVCDWYERSGLGWMDYSYSPHYTSTSWISSFGLSCDRAYISEVLTSAYFAGFGLGSWYFGKVADRRGRRPVTGSMTRSCANASTRRRTS